MKASRFYVLTSKDGIPALVNVSERAASDCFHPDNNQDVKYLNDSGELESVFSDYAGQAYNESDETVTTYINLIRETGQIVGKGQNTEP